MSKPMTAIEMYQQDARFHALALSAVARAMEEARSNLTREIRSRDVHDVALNAVVHALKSAFDNDAELTMTRLERDHYKKLALEFTALTPSAPLVIPIEGLRSSDSADAAG